MTQIQVGGLHHLAMGARDVASLASFYERALGLRRERVHYDHDGQLRSIWLRAQAARADQGLIMIEQTLDRTVDRPPSAVAPGWFLLAFCVLEQQREGLEQQLEQAGAVIESRTTYSTYARDPEGNRVAISCYPLIAEDG